MSSLDIIKSTIMFTDIVGYSAMVNKNQEHALELLTTHDTMIEPIIAQNGGNIIKKIGDSIFAEFPTPQASVHTAQKIQTKLKKRNSVCSNQDQIQIRIGLHTGEAIRKDDDLFGHDVNLCSRIESISPRGGIAASAELVKSLINKPDSTIREMGYVKLKNIVQPQQIYKIYLSQDDYLAESEKQLTQYLHDNGIEILDMDTYTTKETFSAAVLYVKNLGGDKDESIAYGLTEGLINDFAYINNFRTPGFNETLQYKNTELGRDDIGRKLQVDNILQGSVLKEKNTLKLSFELLDINLGRVLWNETWSDHLSNSNNIRSHILTSVLSHFSMEMPKQLSDSLSDEMTNNPNALEAYYNGKYCSDFLTSKKDVANGKILLEKALELDNNFVEAYYLYGLACHRLGNYDAAEIALLKGQEIAEEKNNLQGLAYICKGFSILYDDRGMWGKSIHNIEKALKIQIQLNNNTVEAMLRFDYAGYLNHQGETDLSIEQNKQAGKLLKNLEDDRLFGISCGILTDSYLIKGDYTQSIEYGKKSLGIFRKLGMTSYIGKILSIIGDAFCRTGDFNNLKGVIEEANPIILEFKDIFIQAKINYHSTQYYLNKRDFKAALSYIDQSIDQYNLAEQTRFETQALIEKLTILIESGKMENAGSIISKIEHLINKLKGTYSNELFTATKLYIDVTNGIENDDDVNSLFDSIENTKVKYPLNFPLVYWYLAKTYKAINQIENANACHKKAKQILNFLADRISGKEDKESFYKVFFHNRIQEALL